MRKYDIKYFEWYKRQEQSQKSVRIDVVKGVPIDVGHIRNLIEAFSKK